jgi:hypothetical protein
VTVRVSERLAEELLETDISLPDVLDRLNELCSDARCTARSEDLLMD